MSSFFIFLTFDFLPEAAIAYATFVKSDDGIPEHVGKLSDLYDEYADKILDAQNKTLEYQDEMKVR